MTESGIPALLDDSLVDHTGWQKPLRIPEEKSAEDLCQDYLIRLYQYIVDRLVRQFTKSVIDVTPIKFVLISPANWGEKYKDNLVKSINPISQAGIGTGESTIPPARLVLTPGIDRFYTRNRRFHSQTGINTRNRPILYQESTIPQPDWY